MIRILGFLYCFHLKSKLFFEIIVIICLLFDLFVTHLKQLLLLLGFEEGQNSSQFGVYLKKQKNDRHFFITVFASFGFLNQH